MSHRFKGRWQRLLAVLVLLVPGATACDRRALDGVEAQVPSDFSFVGSRARCDLEVNPPAPRVLRVNCFEVDGRLHVHSNRFASLPRPIGESWVTTVRRDESVRISLSGKIFRLRAIPIDDPGERHAILVARGYGDSPPEGITVFEFAARDQRSID